MVVLLLLRIALGQQHIQNFFQGQGYPSGPAELLPVGVGLAEISAFDERGKSRFMDSAPKLQQDGMPALQRNAEGVPIQCTDMGDFQAFMIRSFWP